MKNIACIGAGYWGKNLIRNFNQIGVLHTICDGREEVLARFSEQYPEVLGRLNVEDVLADKEVNAVCIATPAETHFDLIKQALAAGKHFYVEKPLCLEEQHAVECIEIAESKGLTLMVGHLLWYHPNGARN